MTVSQPPRPTCRRAPRALAVDALTRAELTAAEKVVHDALLAVATFPDLGTGRPVSFAGPARDLTAQILAAAKENP